MGESYLSKSRSPDWYMPPYVSWASGTDAQIAALVEADRAGKLNLNNVWSVGDTRTVNLSAMAGMVVSYTQSSGGILNGRIKLGYSGDTYPYSPFYSTETPSFNTATGTFSVSSSSVTASSYCYLEGITSPTLGALSLRTTSYETRYILIYDNSNTNIIGYFYAYNSGLYTLGSCLETSNWPTTQWATPYIKFSGVPHCYYGAPVTDMPHAAQSVQLVLMDSTCTGFTWASTPASGVTKPRFIVGMKNCLNEQDYMNSTSTNTGGWKDCLRRKWCNDNFKNSLPSELKGIFKEFTWQTGVGGGASSGLNTTTDTFALAPEKAVFGTYNYSFSDEAALYSQWTWYSTAANRKKTVNSSATFWWEGSPYATSSTNFAGVGTAGGTDSKSAEIRVGLSPFGCI